MKSITLFDAKTHLSDLVKEVNSLGEEILITVRGMPRAKLSPYKELNMNTAWEARERYVTVNGEMEDFILPTRAIESPKHPFGDER
jgi:prevent-host-death family protein